MILRRSRGRRKLAMHRHDFLSNSPSISVGRRLPHLPRDRPINAGLCDRSPR
jgi:hypothetical protein